MFVLKQFLKVLILPPLSWMLMLLAVLIFWHRRWARKLLFVTFCLIVVLHSGIFVYLFRYPLESHYPPLIDPTKVEPYDAIVVLTGTTKWSRVRVHLQRMAAVVEAATPGSYTEVDIPFRAQGE